MTYPLTVWCPNVSKRFSIMSWSMNEIFLFLFVAAPLYLQSLVNLKVKTIKERHQIPNPFPCFLFCEYNMHCIWRQYSCQVFWRRRKGTKIVLWSSPRTYISICTRYYKIGFPRNLIPRNICFWRRLLNFTLCVKCYKDYLQVITRIWRTLNI